VLGPSAGLVSSVSWWALQTPPYVGRARSS
jgi:hypothetical protein